MTNDRPEFERSHGCPNHEVRAHTRVSHLRIGCWVQIQIRLPALTVRSRKPGPIPHPTVTVRASRRQKRRYAGTKIWSTDTRRKAVNEARAKAETQSKPSPSSQNLPRAATKIAPNVEREVRGRRSPRSTGDDGIDGNTGSFNVGSIVHGDLNDFCHRVP